MARLFVTGINLNKNELQNAVIQNIGSAPSSPVAGQIYFNTSSNVLYFYNGSEWIPASGSTEVIQDVIGSSLIGGTGLTATYNDVSGETTVDLDNTTVSHGSYGGSNKTVTFTVDQQGRLTAASDTSINITASQVSDFTEATQDAINSALVAGEGIDITYDDANNTISIDAELASDTNKGVASFSATDFTVTTGNVAINHESVQDIVGAMVTSTNIESGINVIYDDINGNLTFDVIDQFPSHSTTDLTEGTNLYYTAERVQDEINNTVVAGTGLDKTYDDNAGTYTLDIDSTVTTNNGTQTLSNKTLGVGNALGADLDAAGYKITNLGTPTSSGDAVNKSYVDGMSAGLNWKQAVNLLATTNIALTGSTGSLVIDGHDALTDIEGNGYRILLKNQSTDTENGIYVYSDNGTTYTLTRSADADTYAELIGAAVFVMEGSTYGSTSWVQTNHYLNSFGSQGWTQFSGAGTYLSGAGLSLNGNVFSVDTVPTSGDASIRTDNGATEVKTDISRGLSVDANGLGINAGTGFTFVSNALSFASGYGVRKYSRDLGDGISTTYTVTHNLFTRDISVQIFDNSSPYAQIEADVEHTNTSTVTIKFASAPTSDQYRIVVIG